MFGSTYHLLIRSLDCCLTAFNSQSEVSGLSTADHYTITTPLRPRVSWRPCRDFSLAATPASASNLTICMLCGPAPSLRLPSRRWNNRAKHMKPFGKRVEKRHFCREPALACLPSLYALARVFRTNHIYFCDR
jgi:hypothetical protein